MKVHCPEGQTHLKVRPEICGNKECPNIRQEVVNNNQPPTAGSPLLIRRPPAYSLNGMALVEVSSVRYPAGEIRHFGDDDRQMGTAPGAGGAPAGEARFQVFEQGFFAVDGNQGILNDGCLSCRRSRC